MKEEWLYNGAVVPVDVETTTALVAEIHRLIGVVGGMALAQPAQRKPLMDAELERLYDAHAKYQEYGAWVSGWFEFARAIEDAHGIKGEA